MSGGKNIDMEYKQSHKIGLIEVKELENHKVRVYKNRLAVWRKDGNKLGWEELQNVKQQVIGDTVAVEVFPSESNVINIKHTRHLWFSDKITSMFESECQHPEFSVGKK